MPRRVEVPHTGVELVVGEPGAGKSYWVVERLLNVIRWTKRPVYTNLPLRWPVVREYLRSRGGPELRNLIRPLSREHFGAFLKRFYERQRFIEDCKTSQDMTRSEAGTAWLQHAGSDVTEGPGAQWLPMGSVIVIDEVHHWTPNAMIVKGASPEGPELLAWLTMHRHGTYWIWAVTQALRQVSQTWRSLASQTHQVINASARPLVFGITAGDFGIRAMLRRSYSREAWNDGSPIMEPHDRRMLFPALPWNRWRFRLYDSFTHVGSRRELEQAVEAVRLAAGVTDAPQSTEVKTMKKPKGRTLVGATLLVGLGAGVAYGVASCSKGGEPAVGAVEESVGVSKEKGEADSKVPEPEVTESVLLGVTGQSALFKGLRLTIGDVVDGRRIVGIESVRGLVLAVDADRDGWLYAVGKGSRRVGPVASLVGAIRAAASRRTGGVAAEPTGGSALGAPAGVAVGVDGASDAAGGSGAGGVR